MLNVICEIISFFNNNSIFITILGFVANTLLNIYFIRVQFKKARKEKIIDQRTDIYFQCYAAADKIIAENKLAYDKNFYSKLELFKPKLKLISSESVVKRYKKLLKDIFKLQNDYTNFISNNSPENNSNNYLTLENDDMEQEVDSVFIPDKLDLYKYNNKLTEFKNANEPKVECIIDDVKNLCEAMRNDICLKGVH